MDNLFIEEQIDDGLVDINISFKPSNSIEKPLLTNNLELFLQEIYLAVRIAPGEIWGVFEAIDLNQYVFNRYITTNFINSEITKFISNNCSQSDNFNYQIDSEIKLDDYNNELIMINCTVLYEDGAILKTFILGDYEFE